MFLTEFYLILLEVLGFIGFYWVLLGFTGFYCVFSSLACCYRVVMGFVRREMSFTGFLMSLNDVR